MENENKNHFDEIIKKRMNFLKNRNLDELQEIFINRDKGNFKICANLIKNDSNQENGCNKIKMNKNFGKRKEKDIVNLDIGLNFNSNLIQTEKESLFSKAIKNFRIDNNEINKGTGLPQTFKIENYDAFSKVIDINKPVKKNFIELLKEEKIHGIEYNEVHSKNIELIKNMSKEELMKYYQIIKTDIPKGLIEKMKKGYFKEKFKTNEKIDCLKDETKAVNEDKNNKIEISNDLKLVDGINYNGELQKVNENENINYFKINFHDLDLNTKYFTFNEIYQLVCSLNDSHIHLGLKILQKILNDDNSLILFKKDFHTYKMGEILFYHLDSKNINIRFYSLENIVFYLEKEYSNDFKNFKTGLFYFNNFPIVKYIKNKNYLYAYIRDNTQKLLNYFNNEFTFNLQKDYHMKLNLRLMKYVLFLSENFAIRCLNSDLNQIFKKNLSSFKDNKLLIHIIFQLCIIDKQEISFYLTTDQILDKYINYIHFLNSILYNKIDDVSLTYIRVIDLCIMMRKLNNLNIIKYSLIIQESNIKLNKKFLIFSKLINLKIKSFKYFNSIEEDYLIINNSELEIIINNFDISFKNVNNYTYEFWLSILKLLKIARKYPKSINYIKISHDSYIINSILKYINENMKLPEFNDIYILYEKENLLKLQITIMKYIIKYYPILDISFIIYNLPSFLNTNSEYYYHKFVKYLPLFINYKTGTNENLNLFLKDTNYNYENLDEDLNIYLNSNEDYRRSVLFKKIMWINENIPTIIYNDNIKSKYFPFKNNFILQVLYNHNIISEVKLNYMKLFVIIFFNTNYINYFEILLNILLHFKDIIFKNNAEKVFQFYIDNLILKNLSIILPKNKENDIIVESYFNKFESLYIDKKEISIFYKITPLFFVLYHTDTKYNNSKLCHLIYTDYIRIYENLENNEYKCLIDYIISNLSIKNYDLYEILINNYIRFKSYETLNENNFLVRLTNDLIMKFFSDGDFDIKNLKEKVYSKLYK